MNKMTELVSKLLAQAEGTDNEHEAEAFTKRAQALATQFSIDLAVARSVSLAKERTTPIVRTITLGERKTRGLNTYVSLISGIASANNVTLNIAANSTFVIAFGFEEDIDIVEALYASLLIQMVTASEVFKREGTWKEDKVRVPARWEYYRMSTGKTVSEKAYWDSWNTDISERFVSASEKSVPWLSARLDFQQAFASKVGTRLYFAKIDAEKEAEESSGDVAGTALVLANKAVEVADFYKEKSTARGSYRGSRDTLVSRTSRNAGYRAAESARLSSQSAVGGARTAIA